MGSSGTFFEARFCVEREISYRQPTGPKPLDHRDDEVDRPRAMGVRIPFFGKPYICLPNL